MPTSTESKSPILADRKEAEQVKVPEYSQDERDYLAGLQLRLERARNVRESPHEEFDGMSYTEWFTSNERGANTYVPPKKNREDTNFVSGTIRDKLFALLAALRNL